MKTSLKIITGITILLAFASCKQEITGGTGGKATITGYIRHHDGIAIPNTAVYIKYKAAASPGTNEADFDGKAMAGEDGKYEFKNLLKGDYYLFGKGIAPDLGISMTGGIAVKIKSDSETINADIPLSE